MTERTSTAPFHAMASQAALDRLGTTSGGLTEHEANVRRESIGPNELPAPARPSLAQLFGRQFRSPLIYILLVAALAALTLGHLVDTAIVALVLLLNAVVGTAQEHRAERSAEALRSMVQQHARVLRDGDVVEVDATLLVPGDVVLLEAGDKVPADLRLIEAASLRTDESLLTGESTLVDKSCDTELADDTPLADRVTAAHAGSTIAAGRGRGLVVATGLQTALGEVAASLTTTRTSPPPLLMRMTRFSRNIAVLVLGTVAVLGAVLLARGETLGDTLAFTIALAVSAIPEGLPVALTVALAVAARRMAARNVIVRGLVTVESLGSCTTIATDKTGTLTRNELTVQAVELPGEDPWPVSGEGLDPTGEVNVPAEAEPLPARAALERLAWAAIACSEAHLDERDGRWTGSGDPVDVALLVLARKLAITVDDVRRSMQPLSSIPFDPLSRYAAALHRDSRHDHVSVKGASERVVQMCSQMATFDGDVAIDPAFVQRRTDELAARGYRVLAIAAGTLPPGTIDELGEHHLRELVLLGLTCFTDPVRSAVPGAVRACRDAGLRVVMVTGDHPRTALAIARETGIAGPHDEAMAAADLALLDDADATQQQRERVLQAAVFARVEPRHKLQLVTHLQDRGEFVAVTGDGVNDAPALRAAHVGVAMGRSGTDVAREASELVLVDDELESIVHGIEEGRVAYANVRKVVTLLVSTAFGMFVLILLAVAFQTPLPLLPAQILWLNLVANGIQDLGLAFEPAEGDELSRPPRRPDEPIFDRLLVQRVAVGALYMGVCCFLVFQLLLERGWSEDAARNSVLLLMVLMSNVQTGASRSERRFVLGISPLRNPILLGGVLVAQAVHIAALYLPGISGVLDTQPVSPRHWLELLVVAVGLFAAMELHKLLTGRRQRRTGG